MPNNATLVIVGDVDTTDAMRRVVRHFGGIQPGDVARRPRIVEPEQLGERRLTLAREGTTAYLKVGYHAPAAKDPSIFESALELLGVTAAESVMVGDSLPYDIEGARRVGMRGILVQRSPDAAVARLPGVPVIRD
ncbi:HAD hydrolase-like protein, partial [bacterium AH-315-O15]|nr:HAD hydrolase-like protein [bacterium AH-315-O15]